MNSCLKLVLGVLGNATSLALFMSPLPTFWKIYKLKSTGNYSGLPYVCTLFTCAFWLLYGTPFVKPHSLMILTINGIGLLLELFYLISYLIFASKQKKVMFVQLTVAMTLAFATVVPMIILVVHTHAMRRLVAGTLCLTLNICMYASPLIVMREVIRNKSVEYMPFLFSLFNLLNALVWFAYSLVTRDIFIAVPNGIGCLCGIVQLILYSLCRRYPQPETCEMKNVEANQIESVLKEEVTVNVFTSPKFLLVQIDIVEGQT